MDVRSARLVFPSVQFSLASQPIQITTVAYSVMATYHFTTFWTPPLPGLCLQKFRHAILLDETKVLNQAHPEQFSISIVDMLQSFARKIWAFIAVFHFAVQKQVAFLLEKSTLLVPRTTTNTVQHPYPPAFHIILPSKVPAANSTIHPTRRHQSLFHIHTSHPSNRLSTFLMQYPIRKLGIRNRVAVRMIGLNVHYGRPQLSVEPPHPQAATLNSNQLYNAQANRVWARRTPTSKNPSLNFSSMPPRKNKNRPPFLFVVAQMGPIQNYHMRIATHVLQTLTILRKHLQRSLITIDADDFADEPHFSLLVNP